MINIYLYKHFLLSDYLRAFSNKTTQLNNPVITSSTSALQYGFQASRWLYTPSVQVVLSDISICPFFSLQDVCICDKKVASNVIEFEECIPCEVNTDFLVIM